MKEESVLDLLMYLFENYMDDDSHLQADPDILKKQLREAGFVPTQIQKAFDWLEGLTKDSSDIPPLEFKTQSPVRIFCPEECEKINLEARGYLVYLEQIGVLDAANRELIIDRVMALESEEIDQDQLKWLILMVLFNQPEFDESFHWVEHMVLDDQPGYFH